MVVLSLNCDHAIHFVVFAVLALSVHSIWIPEYSILGDSYARAVTEYKVVEKRIEDVLVWRALLRG